MKPQFLSYGHIPNDGFITLTQVGMFLVGTIALPITWIAGTMPPWYPFLYAFFTAYLLWELYEYLHGLQTIVFDQKGLYGKRAGNAFLLAYGEMKSIHLKEQPSYTDVRVRFMRTPKRRWYIKFSVNTNKHAAALMQFMEHVNKHGIPITKKV